MRNEAVGGSLADNVALMVKGKFLDIVYELRGRSTWTISRVESFGGGLTLQKRMRKASVAFTLLQRSY